MHNNYYFLRHLSASLEKILMGTVISECFSQSKDELLIRFETETGSFYIKVTALPHFGCLSFPENFQRARKNSVDLFQKLIGQHVRGIRQFKNERSFALKLTNGFSLLFKMHGNRTNVIEFDHDTITELFRNNVTTDLNLHLASLDREIDWSREAFDRSMAGLQSLYFTFGKPVWQYLAAKGFDKKGAVEKWEMIQSLRAELEDPEYYITYLGHTPALSLLETGRIEKTWQAPMPAINDFYYTYNQVFFVLKEKNATLSSLRSRLQSSRNFYTKTHEKLRELQSDNNYKVWADLIMANLHTIKPNSDHATLPNLYQDNQPIEVKLKKELSPQKNAAVYYRKSKNQQIEVDRLTQVLKSKQSEIGHFEESLRMLEATDDIKVIRTIHSELKAEAEPQKQKMTLPYHEFIMNGFRIWVGKNAESNDVLTQKHGYKEDLWLHAKDVAGSHVLIKHQAGKNFPKDVIERAAQLAAYNSKRKNETLCPVIITPKKFVRKRKGDPAGMVVVEREEVILVEPKL